MHEPFQGVLVAQHNLFFALYLYASSVGKPEIEGFSCTNVMAAQILQWKHSKLYLITGDYGKKGATAALLLAKL